MAYSHRFDLRAVAVGIRPGEHEHRAAHFGVIRDSRKCRYQQIQSLFRMQSTEKQYDWPVSQSGVLRAESGGRWQLAELIQIHSIGFDDRLGFQLERP